MWSPLKRQRFWVLVLLSLGVVSPGALAEEETRVIPVESRPARQPAVAAPDTDDLWLTPALGYYKGQGYDNVCRSSTPDCDDVGGPSGHLSLNLRTPRLLVRLRASYLVGYTSNTAEEVALGLGLPLGSSGRRHFVVGVSRLTDVAADRQGPTVGVPLELLLHSSEGGVEFSLHGNLNDDSDFIGALVGWPFGYGT
ncbi:MAG TPA: hypothetical protein VFV27_05490 [Nevskiaceae bacterium]|nr:hypothetical protein [Nevskiaceae bacterium]